MTSSSTSKPRQLTQLHVPGEPSAWSNAGFAGSDQFRLGNTVVVPLPLAPAMSGTIEGVDELDGLVLSPAVDSAPVEAVPHANSAVAIDHVVIATPDCDRTTERFVQAGFDTRRVRRFDTAKGVRRQTFFWMGDVVCELVGPDEKEGDGPATWWGLAITVNDLARARADLGDHSTDIRAAVQPGRQVCTIRSSAELGVPTLLISIHVPGARQTEDLNS